MRSGDSLDGSTGRSRKRGPRRSGRADPPKDSPIGLGTLICSTLIIVFALLLAATYAVRSWILISVGLGDVLLMVCALFGLGGVAVLAALSYRRQRSVEDNLELAVAKDEREQVAALRERFTAVAGQLASPTAQVRLAGVYGLAALTDDWQARGDRADAQVCINLLCGYLRSPRQEALFGEGQTTSQQADTEVRMAISSVIANHLRISDMDSDTAQRKGDGDDELPTATEILPAWAGYVFDLTGAHFDAGTHDYSRIRVTDGTRLILDRAAFTGAVVAFDDVCFSGGQVSFEMAGFSNGLVSFGGAVFSGGRVSFEGAGFSGGRTSFDAARFSGSQVVFDCVGFSGSRVSFGRAEFSAGQVSFGGAVFSRGTVLFDLAVLSGGRALFDMAVFSGGRVSFGGTHFTGCRVSFGSAVFSGGLVSFGGAVFSDGEASFGEAVFSGGDVSFGRVGWSEECDLHGPWGAGLPPDGNRPGLLVHV